MRKTLVGVALGIAVFACAAALAQHDEKQVTVKGEVLDMACYVAMDGHGADHAGCAKKCLQQGQPMGLLAEDGTVYLLFAGHGDTSAYDKAKDFGGQKVEIQGAPAEKGGLKGITVASVKAL